MVNKLTLFLIFMLICFAIIINLPFLNLNNSYSCCDWRMSHVNTLEVMKVALMQGKLPLWSQSVSAGMSFFAMPDKPFLYPPVLLTLYFFSANQTMNLMLIFHSILGALFMFLLLNYLVKDKFSAFIGAMIFMFSSPLISSPPFWRFSYAWIPLIMYFLIRAIKEEKYAKLSVYCGLSLIMMFFAGGIYYFYYTMLFLVGIFLLLNLIFRAVSIKKMLVILFILGLIIGGFGAIKLLPYMEWTGMTNRGAGYSVEQSLGAKLTFSNMFGILFSGETKETPYQVSLIGLFLGLLSLMFWRQKNVLIFSILLLIILVFNSGFLYGLWYKIVPMLSSQHGVMRSLFVFSFCKSVLVGYGTFWLLQKFKNFRIQIFFGLMVLIILNLLFFMHYQPPQLEDYSLQRDGNPIMNFLAEQNDTFRFNVVETYGGIDWSDIEIMSVPKGEEDISQAFGSFMFNDLYNFISLGYANDAQNYAKIYGILNTKYFISGSERNIANLTFIKKFDENLKIPIDFLDNFLYINENVLPRISYFNSTILVIGNLNQTKQVIDYLLLNNVDTSKINIVSSKVEKLDYLWGVNNFSVLPINDFDAIILMEGAVDGASFSLRNYVSNGGKLFPDIIKGEKIIDGVSFMNYINGLENVSGNNVEEDNFVYSQNQLVIKNPHPGWMVISEQFFNFPGWFAYADGKWIQIFKTDNIISSVYVPNNIRELKFVYQPSSFTIGRNISIFTFISLIIILYLIRKK